MNPLNLITLDKEVENILLSEKTTFEDTKKNNSEHSDSYSEVTDTNRLWIAIYNSSTNNMIQGVPKLAFNYAKSRAKFAYENMKRFSKKFNVSLIDTGREYRKVCYIFSHKNRPKNENEENDNIQSNRQKEENKKSFITGISPNKKQKLNYGMTINNKTKNKFNSEREMLKDEEEQFETEKKLMNHLESIKKKNRLNIYIGEYQVYNSKTTQELEKINIYDGSLLHSTFLLNNKKEKLNVNTSSKLKENLDMKELLKYEGGMFIPSDFTKARQKQYIMGKFFEEKTDGNSLRKDMNETTKKLLSVLIKSISGKEFHTKSNTAPISLKGIIKSEIVNKFLSKSKSNINMNAKIKSPRLTNSSDKIKRNLTFKNSISGLSKKLINNNLLTFNKPLTSLKISKNKGIMNTNDYQDLKIKIPNIISFPRNKNHKLIPQINSELNSHFSTTNHNTNQNTNYENLLSKSNSRPKSTRNKTAIKKIQNLDFLNKADFYYIK